MSCQRVRGFLDAYVDRELDVVSTLEFERHLTECVSCRAICDKYHQLHDSVQSKIPYFEAPQPLEEKIRARLRLGQHDRKTTMPSEALAGWRVWGIAASLVILLVSSAVLLDTLRRPPASEMLAQQVVSSHIRSLMANHLSDVISTDQHTVKPWFSGKLDFAPVVKDLASEGFPLAGGRLEYLDNHAVAALVYKHRQHTINLFLWPSPNSSSSPHATTIKGFNVVHWTESHMTYWAVSDLNGTELTQFANDLRK